MVGIEKKEEWQRIKEREEGQGEGDGYSEGNGKKKDSVGHS